MNDTISSLLQIRGSSAGAGQPSRRLAIRFLAGLLLFALSFLTGFLLSPTVPLADDGVFLAVSPVTGGHPASAVLSVLRCLFPSAIALSGIYAAAHTPWPTAVSGAVIVWRGICLGCAGAFMKNGTVISIGQHWIPALILYFAASVLIILLASCSHPVSLYLCRAYADGDIRRFREAAVDWLRMFLVISGAVFAMGAAAVLLIQGSI